MSLSQDLLKEIFDYRDGNLYRRISRGNCKGGSLVGRLDNTTNYMRVEIGGKKLLLHRVIFLYFNGYLPKFIDHIDNNKLNNKIENLREATKSQNRRNSKLPCNNKSGFKGVYLNKSSNRFQAQIRLKDNCKSLGYYNTAEEAHKAYCLEASKLYGEFARYN